MAPIDEDPAPTEGAGQSKSRLVKFILNELTEAALQYMRVDPTRARTKQLSMLPVAQSPRPLFGRKTKPIPIIKEVWHIGVLIGAESDPMALYVGMDGTPYCTYFEAGVGERQAEVTEDFLGGLSLATLQDIHITVQEKRSEIAL